MPTDRTLPHVALTRDAAEKISSSPMTSGDLVFRFAPSERLYIAETVETKPDLRMQVTIPREFTALRWGDSDHHGQWIRDPSPDINLHHLILLQRPGVRLPFDAFRKLVRGVEHPGRNHGLLITHEPGLTEDERLIGASEFAGWLVHRSGVLPIRLDIEPEVVGIQQLAGRWPVELLAGHSVMLVGCGSIGGAAAEALAGSGLGRVELVDPDRFLWHNTIRHVLGPESVGRRKVDALKSHLERRWPDQNANAHPLDIVEDAHLLRPLFDRVDLVLCAADGIAPRRVVSHLARRAAKPAVLACVLDSGALGEVIRLRPTPRFGCLLCLRQDLVDQGAMDAEADQELGYGAGLSHLPMTAVPPDLRYIGTLAAKVAVATLLESLHGDRTQRLPGEHAVVGLNPVHEHGPPFNLEHAGEIRWRSLPPPRPACPTCGPA
ncbi:ThiF family adenylyltransferase [Glycomyces dulcitolivorans]|uniref:ThiF family adenylyltransferase n=1 Tax=Glycomyces dulcitolivorans TaxID=2200759 RepID=UPI000DD3065E|nr:ThiF family adenylyltransferase [Glycomyces dulcitolivorans]